MIIVHFYEIINDQCWLRHLRLASRWSPQACKVGHCFPWGQVFVSFAFSLPSSTHLLVHGGRGVQLHVRPHILHWEFSVTGVRGRLPIGGYHGYTPLFVCIINNISLFLTCVCAPSADLTQLNNCSNHRWWLPSLISPLRLFQVAL